MEEYIKQLFGQISDSLSREILQSMDRETLNYLDRNTLFNIIEDFITSVEFKGKTKDDLENFMILFNVLEVLINAYNDENLIEKIEKYPEIKEFITDLLYSWNYFIKASNFLFNLNAEFIKQYEEYNIERKAFMKEKKNFNSTKTITRQKEKTINNLQEWTEDIISVLDRTISTDPLPEGKEYILTDRDKSLLINHLQKQISHKENMSLKNIYLRLIDSQAVKIPHPADYEYDYDHNLNIINFKQAIYAKGDIEVVIKKDLPTEILEEPILYKNQILDTLTNRIIMYTYNITIPFPLFFGILNGKDETPEITITVRDQSQIIWEHGTYYVSKKWYDELKKIINKSGLEGLIEAGWISENDKEFINNKLKDNNETYPYSNHFDNPYIILADMLDKVINTEWKGKTSQLHELIGFSDTFPDNQLGTQKLGRIMSKATEEDIIPGFKIDEIRIGETRQKGYHIYHI